MQLVIHVNQQKRHQKLSFSLRKLIMIIESILRFIVILNNHVCYGSQTCIYNASKGYNNNFITMEHKYK